MQFTRANLFVLLAFVFFLIDALITGGVITSSTSYAWLLPAGLASYMVALLV